MKMLAVTAAAAIAVPLALAPTVTARADDPVVPPTISKIDLSFDEAVISASSPCVSIPVTVTFANNGGYVYGIDVYATRGTLPTDGSAPSGQLVIPQSDAGTATSATGTFNYCASTQGVGKLFAGPSIIHYSGASQVGQSEQKDPATETFYVQQASLASLKATRDHKAVTLTAVETYYDYTNSANKLTTSQPAYFQYLKGKKWKTIAKDKPSPSKGYARIKVKSKHQRNYRVVFKPSTSIATAVSDILNK